jgi:hypothetical protein
LLCFAQSNEFRYVGQRLNASGEPIPSDAPSSAPPEERSAGEGNIWVPFKDRLAFEAADFLYRRSRMPQAQVDVLMNLWAASMFESGYSPPFASNGGLLNVIDSIDDGVIPWEESEIDVSDTISTLSPSYMRDKYKIYYRNPHQLLLRMLRNREFHGQFDYAAYQRVDDNGKRRYCNVMSANHAWRRSVSHLHIRAPTQ